MSKCKLKLLECFWLIVNSHSLIKNKTTKMKKKILLFPGLFFLLLSVNVRAQSNDSTNYFVGKWSVLIKGTPNGDGKMFVVLAKKDTTLTGVVQDSTGKELSKIDKAELKGNTATVYFVTQGFDVYLEMAKKDDDHFKGSMMGMFDAEGDRVKKSK